MKIPKLCFDVFQTHTEREPPTSAPLTHTGERVLCIVSGARREACVLLKTFAKLHAKQRRHLLHLTATKACEFTAHKTAILPVNISAAPEAWTPAILTVTRIHSGSTQTRQSRSISTRRERTHGVQAEASVTEWISQVVYPHPARSLALSRSLFLFLSLSLFRSLTLLLSFLLSCYRGTSLTRNAPP